MEGMTTETFVLALVGGCIGSVFAYFIERWWLKKHDDKPYKWKCTRNSCGFSIESNQHEFVLVMAERHERNHR